MARFNGEVTFRVKFKDLGVPVGWNDKRYSIS